MKIRLAAALFTTVVFFPLWGDQYYLKEGNYRINVPVKWEMYSEEGETRDLSFISDDQSVIMQISWYEGSQFDDVNDMYRYFADGIGAQKNDQSLLPYLEWQSLLADISFESGGNRFRGWYLFLDGDGFDYRVIVFSSEGDYETAFPYILSCLDSFSPGEESRRSPGIISRLFYPEENAAYEKKTDILNGRAFIYDYDPFELEASQVVIEREAPLLTRYNRGTPEAALAWDRYYKLIYRDNFHRFDEIYEALKPHFTGKSSLETAETLLKWFQGFEYGSSGTFSDLLSPLASTLRGVGDCDSLALAYLILLEHFGIDGILLVSEEYAHAMAGVAVDRGGYTFDVGGESYLFAEMTKEVDMGMIASNMTDPAKWQPISFRE